MCESPSIILREVPLQRNQHCESEVCSFSEIPDDPADDPERCTVVERTANLM